MGNGLAMLRAATLVKANFPRGSFNLHFDKDSWKFFVENNDRENNSLLGHIYP